MVVTGMASRAVKTGNERVDRHPPIGQRPGAGNADGLVTKD
jgi:hypothetical protein